METLAATQVQMIKRSDKARQEGSSSTLTRVLVFNFFGGVMDRGIPLYARDIAECMRRVGAEPIELRCPRWLRGSPRLLRNAAFAVYEQIVAPVVRVLRGCSITVYPYNSAGIVDAMLGRSVVVVHDLIGNGRANSTFAARYIRYTQSIHRRLERPVCAASAHTLRHLRQLPAFRRCALRLWSNPFYSFEKAIADRDLAPPRGGGGRLRVLLCSGIGPNKDFAGAVHLFRDSQLLRDAELRIVGFGDDAHLAEHRIEKLPLAIRRRISVLPRLSLTELVAEYAASDLVWVHSRKEGFGRSVVEARLLDRPVLASNISAFRRFRGMGVYLYPRGHFDAGVSRVLHGQPAPRIDTSTFHAPLETAVRDVLGLRSVGLNSKAEAAQNELSS